MTQEVRAFISAEVNHQALSLHGDSHFTFPFTDRADINMIVQITRYKFPNVDSQFLTYTNELTYHTKFDYSQNDQIKNNYNLINPGIINLFLFCPFYVPSSTLSTSTLNPMSPVSMATDLCVREGQRVRRAPVVPPPRQAPVLGAPLHPSPPPAPTDRRTLVVLGLRPSQEYLRNNKQIFKPGIPTKCS